jgi:WD40 repeat protein/serine/threonine protein kinase
MHDRDIFLGALELDSPTERAAYVQQACGGDTALQSRVEAMLAFQDQENSFLQSPCLEADKWPNVSMAVVGEGTVIDRYKVLEQIGEGGFAVVFMAEQTEPVRRKVALKLIKPGMDSKQVLGRFDAERQAVALMDHPNIAKVFDGGMTDSGRPYFVMELVHGVPLTEFCDAHKLSTGERLAIFLQICRAVQHAHQKGIIHRDLKPSNVLVTMHDETPVPKVIDFGIAKATAEPLTERTVFTKFKHFIGTPAYISPEQATFHELDIDTRSDVYSLGVLLYELLTGTTPFDKEKLKSAALDELCRIIREDNPVTPSSRISTLGEQLRQTAENRKIEPAKLRELVSGELDWIVMKALEKDRNRRYDSASALAADVQRYLNHEPVLAGPPSTAYRLRKMYQRNRRLFATAAAVALSLILGMIGSTAGYFSAAKARDDAVLSKNDALVARNHEADARRHAQDQAEQRRQLLYVSDVNNARQALDAGNVDYAVALLRRHMPKAGEEDLRSFAWYYMWDQCHQYKESLSFNAPLHTVALSPDGQYLAVAGEGGLVSLISAATHQPAFTLPVEFETIMSIRFSPDGRSLAIGGGSRGGPGRVEIWDWKERVRRRELHPEGSRKVACVAYSPDGQRLACSDMNRRIVIWDLSEGSESEPVLIEQPGWITLAIAFSPDGDKLAAGSWFYSNNVVRFWDADTGDPLEPVNVNEGVRCMAYSPDGKLLAVGTVNTQAPVNLIDVSSRRTSSKVVHTLAAQNCVAESLAYSPDGSKLFVGNFRGSILAFDLPSGEPAGMLAGHSSIVTGMVAVSDRLLVSSSHDRTLKFWDLAAAAVPETIAIGHPWDAAWLRFSHDSRILATSSSSAGAPPGTKRSLRLWDVPSGQLKGICSEGGGEIRRIEFAPDSKRLAWEEVRPNGGDSGELSIVVRDLETEREVTVSGLAARPLGIEFSSGDLLTAVGFESSAETAGQAEHAGQTLYRTSWRLDTGQKTSREALATISLSPDRDLNPPGFPPFRHAHVVPDFTTRLSHHGRLYAQAHGSSVRLWNVQTGELNTLDGGHSEVVLFVAFDPTDRVMASCSQDKSICLWDTTTRELIATLVGRTLPYSMAFSPDGTTLATGDIDGKVTLWDLRTFAEILTLNVTDDVVTGLAFSPDGQALACGELKGKVHVWRAPRK